MCLVAVIVAPHFRPIVESLKITASIGIIALLLFVSTFSFRTRVLIGRFGLRYRTVRRTFGSVAGLLLSLLVAQRLSVEMSPQVAAPFGGPRSAVPAEKAMPPGHEGGMLPTPMAPSSGTVTAYDTLPHEFLASFLEARPGISEFGGMTVKQFLDMLDSGLMNDGRRSRILSWSKNDNDYTIRVTGKIGPYNLIFTHDLSLGGQVSYLHPIDFPDGQELDAWTFIVTVVSGPKATVLVR
jgi:hypothetical protein